MCGDAWQLQDFHVRRQEKEAAEVFLRLVYQHFGFRLSSRGKGMCRRVFGGDQWPWTSLDHFVDFPDSPDRLIRSHHLVMDAPMLRMIDPLLAEPVEMLRTYDSGLPELVTSADRLEEFCQILSRRLVRYYELETEQERLREELEGFARRLDALAEPPDAEALVEDLYDLEQHCAQFRRAQEEREEARRAMLAKEKELREAERALALAGAAVHLSRDLKPAEKGEGGARTAREWLKVKNTSISDARAMLESPGTPQAQKDAIRDVTLPRLTDEVARIQAALDDATVGERKTLDSVRAEVQAARDRYHRMPQPDSSELESENAEVARRYAEVRGQLPEVEREGLPEAIPGIDEWERGKAWDLAQLLRESAKRVRDARQSYEAEIQFLWTEVGRIDREMGELGRGITNFRAAALVLAEQVLTSLGASPEDSAMQELKKLQEGVAEVQKLFSAAEDRLGRLEQVRFMLTHGRKGEEMIKGVKDRLEIYTRTLGKIGTWGGRVLKANELLEKMDDPRKAPEALGEALEMADPLVGMVPMQGAMMGQFLGFYAKAATACASAVLRIQDKYIEHDIERVFRDPPPERHLYLYSEVDASSDLWSDDAKHRIADILQVRRLLFLCQAGNRGEAAEMRR
jgi:hypothetical protein